MGSEELDAGVRLVATPYPTEGYPAELLFEFDEPAAVDADVAEADPVPFPVDGLFPF